MEEGDPLVYHEREPVVSQLDEDGLVPLIVDTLREAELLLRASSWR